MNPNLNWNRERWRTRDRLLDYDFSIVPPLPHSAGLSIVYPWEGIASVQLLEQIIDTAKLRGYIANEEDFWNIIHNYEAMSIDNNLGEGQP